MKFSLLLSGMLLLLLTGSASAGPPLCGFESAVPGSDASTVCQNLLITTPSGDPVTIVQSGNSTAVAYGADNDHLGAIGSRNNCLEDAIGNRYNAITNIPLNDVANGFSNLIAQGTENPQNLIFTFQNGVTVSSFSVKMFDFGDFNPKRATSHKVTVEAFDSIGNPLDTKQLSFTSSNAVNPRANGSNVGDLWYTGDACTANEGAPGYYPFSVNGAGIAKVVLTTTTGGQDPNVAFDSINYTRDNGCTLGYWKNHQDEWANTPYDPNTLLESVFQNYGYFSSTVTLLDALQFKGGPKLDGAARILLRQAVAALLNATDPNVAYPLTSTEIIQDVNAAQATGDRDTMISLANQLDAFNNLNCTVN